MFWTVVLFLVGLLLIIKGGDIFVDAATWFAEKSGIPKLIVGATIVSFATTLPELVASIVGTVDGSLGIAVGNAIGSVTANTGMIMAISIIFMPSIVERKQYAFKSIILMLVALLLGLLLLNGGLSIIESIIVILFAVAFFWENIVVAKENMRLVIKNKEEEIEKVIIEEENSEGKTNFFKKILGKVKLNKKEELIINIVKFLLGAAGIFFGARFLVSEGTKIAQALKVSEAVIGLTLVAIGTSLPELVTTITAIAKKQSSLSIGNIIGANIIDMSLILPVCAFISGGTLVLDSMQTVYLDIPVSLIVMMVGLVPMLITKKFQRWQGIVMLVIYITYLVIVCGNFIQF